MVYFVRLPDRTIKIGFSKWVGTRLKRLEFVYGGPIEILGTMQGGRDEERALHDRFSEFRIDRTEQFHEAPEILECIRLEAVPRAENEANDTQIAVGIRLDPDLAKFARLNWAETGENVSAFINRLLRREMSSQNQRPPAA